MGSFLTEVIQGPFANVYWFNPGGSRDPARFFRGLEIPTRAKFLATIADFAISGTLGFNRGHREAWENQNPRGQEVMLFKFKAEPLVRFFSVVHVHRGERRVVLVYGFKAAKKDRLDRREKERAEAVAASYLATLECQGGIQ